MPEDALKTIDQKLTVISRLLALNIIRGRPVNEQMQMLHNAGMSISEIASTLGRTSNNVRVQLHLMRKKGRTNTGEDIEQE